MTLCRAQEGDSLQEEGGSADFSDADLDAGGTNGRVLEYVGRIHLSPPCHVQRTVVFRILLEHTFPSRGKQKPIWTIWT